MKRFFLWSAVAFCALFPSLSSAQNTGRIECPRSDGYVYLYSSMTTLDVRATLQCGDVVQVTGRYDSYYGVRTAKGDTGYLPLASIVLLKDQPGSSLPASTSGPPARERIHYDEGPSKTPAPARSSVPAFTLLNNTPIHVALSKTISSATAHVGDAVEFDVLEDVNVDGVAVLAKGAKVSGVIAEAERKKRFGHAGKLVFRITSVNLADGEKATVRCYQEVSGSPNTSSADGVLPLGSGKDAMIPKDTQFTALVDGNMPLKREAFLTARDSPAAPAATGTQTPQH
jgi:hypothetical protein